MKRMHFHHSMPGCGIPDGGHAQHSMTRDAACHDARPKQPTMYEQLCAAKRERAWAEDRIRDLQRKKQFDTPQWCDVSEKLRALEEEIARLEFLTVDSAAPSPQKHRLTLAALNRWHRAFWASAEEKQHG